jgi:outer membrane protein OmpA-like peptidoglycan-associated protein
VATALTDRKENIVVEGHTDSRGSDSYNLDLSERRAQSVRDYLVTRGVSANHCRAVGYGESRPVADNRTAEGRANNRRVEIVIERSLANR